MVQKKLDFGMSENSGFLSRQNSGQDSDNTIIKAIKKKKAIKPNPNVFKRLSNLGTFSSNMKKKTKSIIPQKEFLKNQKRGFTMLYKKPTITK